MDIVNGYVNHTKNKLNTENLVTITVDKSMTIKTVENCHWELDYRFLK